MRTPLAIFVASLLVAMLQVTESTPLKVYRKIDPVKDFCKWLQEISRTSGPAPCNDNDRLPGRPKSYDIDFEKVLREKQRKDEEKKEKEHHPPSHGRVRLSEIQTSKGNGKIISQIYVVALDGSGNFTSVQAAVDKVPTNNLQRVVIYVKKGIYREKISIPSNKPFITLQGEDAVLTYLEWNDTASVIGPDGNPLGTYQSASVAVNSDNFIALDISIRNTAPAPAAGAQGKQAVALRVTGDKAAFYQCNFYGAQDTLYDHAGRHYYYKCFIEGSIDFIFGDARSLFASCHLHSIATPYGSVAAQKRMTPSEDTGFSFVNCIVTGSGNIFLGRAWGPFSRIVYAFTYLDNIIAPQGWNDWNNATNDRTVFYGEYKCFGPGSHTSNRVVWSKQLTNAQVQPFLHVGFINGSQWLQQ